MERGHGTALVLGGARSGKSSWAEAQLRDRTVVDYVATSLVDDDDPEWQDRVALHRSRRPGSWRTLETLDVAAVVRDPDEAPVLVDCLALWLSRTLDDVDAWQADEAVWRPALEQRVDDLVDALGTTSREVILVSNEVGSGVVPATASGRMYRDELGRLNARVAAACDELWLCVGGFGRRWR
ncbi:bifunctional adenosylcobinamide kinase/adenosylcobinamide-phosphate guanylyltransferase [Tessaracoccus antarcticus]|uniref:Adenosylcobinamide kinase n=2 Tax=Tessaracoccus antarcticus TaxID=2479848 RepID=A0A3M0GYT1_9ACTN|nr:bifunctional adenosylcobinamide kinase/adenosylcobinamide-phosphate guanylyltransferase [Tessaracoccus antarcticus]